MAGYRFANPNAASMEGTIGNALNKAAGSVDNIAIALMRGMKSPEERALMDAHQSYYNANARKIAAEAEAQDIVNQNSRDPLGAIAQAVLGGDRDTARSNAIEAMNFAAGKMDGPVLPQYVEAVPQINRRLDAVTLANLTDPKSIAHVMKNILAEQQQGDITAGRATPQSVLTNNYATGVTTNKPVDIDQGGLKLELGSGNVSDTSVSLAANALRKAQSNASNAAANKSNAGAAMDRSHAALYDAETQNEKDGKPGRNSRGSSGDGSEKPETAAQRMKRESGNTGIANDRQFIIDLGIPKDELFSKDSPYKHRLENALKPMIGVEDTGYKEFAAKFGKADEGTVADVMKRVMELDSEKGWLGGKKNDPKAIGAAIRSEFRGRLGDNEVGQIVSDALAGRKPASAQQPTTAQQSAQQPQQPGPAEMPPEVVAKLKEGVQTKFGSGQVWTLQNGKPVRVK